MDIAIRFIPNRVQFSIDASSDNQTVHQNATFANNVPQLDFVSPGMAPTATPGTIDAYY
jgi:hypothetical protein